VRRLRRPSASGPIGAASEIGSDSDANQRSASNAKLEPRYDSGVFGGLCRSPLLTKLVLTILAGLCFFGFAIGGIVSGSNVRLGLAIALATATLLVLLFVAFENTTRCQKLSEQHTSQQKHEHPRDHNTCYGKCIPL
jgi:Flp pilus assembly protein TadB